MTRFRIAASSFALLAAVSSANAESALDASRVPGPGTSVREIEVQVLKDFRSLQSLPTPQLSKLFKKITTTYRRKGYGKIAGALRSSLPALQNVVTAEKRSDLDRPRANRAIRRVLQSALAPQPIVTPTTKDPTVPFYTLIAANYGAQLRDAYRNAFKDRPIAKGFGKTPRDMWIRDTGTNLTIAGGTLAPTLKLGSGIVYTLTNSQGTWSGSLTDSGFIASNSSFNPGTFTAGEVSLTLADFDGILIALPQGSPAPASAVVWVNPETTTLVSNDLFTFGMVSYDLSVLPTEPPHRIYGVPQGSDLPEGAILLTPIEQPEATPTPEP